MFTPLQPDAPCLYANDELSTLLNDEVNQRDAAYYHQEHIIVSPTSVVSSRFSELPILVNRLDCPIELLPQCFGKELLDRHVKLLREDNGESRVDVILYYALATELTTSLATAARLRSWTCRAPPPCCSPCLQLDMTCSECAGPASPAAVPVSLQ